MRYCHTVYVLSVAGGGLPRCDEGAHCRCELCRQLGGHYILVHRVVLDRVRDSRLFRRHYYGASLRIEDSRDLPSCS